MDSRLRHAHGVSRPLIGLAALLCGLTVANAAAQGNAETDRAALTTLYHATGGASWTNNTNWLSNEPLSEWFGVTTESGRVTHLSLAPNGLSGSLPAALGNLTELEWLSLFDNALSGTDPA